MLTLRRGLLSAVGTTTAVTAAVLLGAGPAAALDYYRVITYASGDYIGSAGAEWFYPDGDRISVCDNWGDGAGVAGYWKVGSGGSVTKIYSGGGIGTCEERNYNFAESSTVYIKVCIQDNGDVKEGTCSNWKEAPADGIS
ncbi:hypothetical protein [Streptomyces cavernae]|uniref:hypothetical protein n=1 Tax=Streptomyces cavernae TaxID=2259034 RepID=UPI000FEC12A3|nr:hypothetical protein [Streptomyces cavernae]